ncbi:GntR family transcriptional regulator [Poseidonocella sedimentorum]|uniref:DNA-binding transcriptional regulator, GntR family n=1 Tax=Poseidonocella sedimentorum TaxID=871652 RepID=A0A1I6E3B7_9RHOB|nr:GntR family transcriptional regulator [Poseidonocella sedimentorum]SFR12213.1 DNA-binding transcriptional regulator, GntR family [Poseidonocella sedimentorum]
MSGQAADLTVAFADGTPLYLQVAQHVQKLIDDGTYPVGSLLPRESDLAEALGVSRHTIRQAISQLRQRGLLTARKGVGTRVEAPQDDWRSRFSANSRGGLFDFARATELHFKTRKTVEARGQIAAEMGVRPGRKFHYLSGPRYYAGDAKPFCVNEVYLDPRLRHVVDDIPILRVALFNLVEEATGDRVMEIQQDVRAAYMPDHVAHWLDREPGDLALKMTRRYLGSGARLLEYAVQYHPGDNFAYHTTLSSI